jgi:hypothetical protein
VAQRPEVENSVFWEITSPDLSAPSYLFGTFHLMGSRYIDSLTNVMAKFDSSEAFAGEIVFDSAMIPNMMRASLMKDTTLNQLLSPETYQQTAQWLKELSGFELRFFDRMNPMAIQILIMSLLQQKHYPSDPRLDTPMDLYFQNLSKSAGKPVTGLETFEDQIYALYGQFSYSRLAEILTVFVQERDSAKSELLQMNRHYREGNLTKMEEMLRTHYYYDSETAVMADDRNKKWMEKIPALLKEQSTFIAVGALHLAGENGLVNLLRKKGYTVTPLALKHD